MISTRSPRRAAVLCVIAACGSRPPFPTATAPAATPPAASPRFQMVVQPGLAEDLETITFSPDGRRILAAGSDGHGVVWDLDALEPAFVLDHGDAWIRAAAFLPGDRVLTCTFGGVHVWSAAHEPRTVFVPDTAIETCAVSPDGTRVAIALDRADPFAPWDLPLPVLVVDVATGELIETLERAPSSGAPAFSPDGTLLLSPAPDPAGAAPAPESLGPGERLAVTAPDGRLRAAAGWDGDLRIHATATGGSVSLLYGHGEWLAYADDGSFDGSAGGGMLLAVVQGLHGYDPGQFAAWWRHRAALRARLAGDEPPPRARPEVPAGCVLDPAALRAPHLELLDSRDGIAAVTLELAIASPGCAVASYTVLLDGVAGEPVAIPPVEASRSLAVEVAAGDATTIEVRVRDQGAIESAPGAAILRRQPR